VSGPPHGWRAVPPRGRTVVRPGNRPLAHDIQLRGSQESTDIRRRDKLDAKRNLQTQKVIGITMPTQIQQEHAILHTNHSNVSCG